MSVLRNGTGILLRGLGIPAWLRRRYAGALRIVMFHGVASDHGDGSISPDDFAHHLQRIKEHYAVLPFREVLSALRDRGPLPRDTAVLTMDDGFLNQYEVARQVLESHSLPATIFLPTRLMDRGELIWTSRVDRLFLQAGGCVPRPQTATERRRRRQVLAESAGVKSRLKAQSHQERMAGIEGLAARLNPDGLPLDPGEDGLMTWEMAREMETSKLFDFGSHSCTHPLLTQVDDDQLEAELLDSWHSLKSRLSRPLPVMCYPDGNHDSRVVRATMKAGYAAAVSTRHGLVHPGDPPYTLRRIGVYRDTGPALLDCKLAGLGASPAGEELRPSASEQDSES